MYGFVILVVVVIFVLSCVFWVVVCRGAIVAFVSSGIVFGVVVVCIFRV